MLICCVNHDHMSQDKHTELLGMNTSTASARLRKMLLHRLADQLNLLECFRCKERIDTYEELSVDHVEPWRGVSADLFWDLNNLAFSHRRCNVCDRPTRKQSPDGMSWCFRCKRHLAIAMFGQGKRWNGLNSICLKCDRERAAEYERKNTRFPCPQCSKPMRKKCRSCGFDLPMKDYMRLRRLEGAEY